MTEPEILNSKPETRNSESLTVVGWLWRGGVYRPEHANIWARMIARHLSMPHRFVLMTDYTGAEFDPLITPVALWEDWRELKNSAWGADKPQCYVRLKAFSREAAELLGPRFVSIDLDIVVLAALDPLFDRAEDFLILRRTPLNQSERSSTYQGSMWLMTAGARERVWSEFKGAETVAAAAPYIGTDQAVMRHVLGPDEKGWTEEDGVYCFRNIQRAGAKYAARAPKNARIVVFNSAKKPWDFPAGEKAGVPRCHQCQAPIRLDSPWALSWTRGSRAEYPWIAENYK